MSGDFGVIFLMGFSEFFNFMNDFIDRNSS